MLTLNDYLERCKNATKSPSDNQLAIKSGITRSAISNWRVGLRTPDDEAILKLAEISKLDLDEALLLASFWRAEGRVKARYKAMIMARNAAATIALSFGLLASPIGTSHSNATEISDTMPVSAEEMFIMRNNIIKNR